MIAASITAAHRQAQSFCAAIVFSLGCVVGSVSLLYAASISAPASFATTVDSEPPISGHFIGLATVTQTVELITPTSLYNTRDREMGFRFVGTTLPISVSIINPTAQIAISGTLVLQGQPATNPERTSTIVTMTFTLHSQTQPGQYSVRVTTIDGQSVDSTDKLTIFAPIGASITAVEPNIMIVPRNYAIESTLPFTLSGNNLELARGCQVTDDSRTCTISSASDSALHVGLEGCVGSGSNNTQCQIFVTFADDSRLASPNIGLIPRVFPWNIDSGRSWIVIILGSLIVGGILFSFCNNRLFEPQFQNMVAPTVTQLAIYCFMLAVATFAVNGVVSGTLGAEVSTFGLIATLSGLNTLQPITLAYLNRRSGSLKSKRTAFALALGLVLLALLSPLILSIFLVRPEVGFAAIIVELSITGVVLLIGAGGVEFGRRQLSEERHKGPSDVGVLATIESVLYRHGRVNAAIDLKDLPADQISRVLSKFYANTRETQSVEYDPVQQRLLLGRADVIRSVGDAFESVRVPHSVPEGVPNETQPERIRDAAIGQLAASLGFTIRSADPPISTESFFARKILPVGLESVLPPSLPFILFPGAQAISTAQMTEIQQLQNLLDIPNRFAVLFPLGQTLATRERIHNGLGGAARENIVVLDEHDVASILASKEDLRLAFMRAVQEQIDLTILSPYQERAPTRLDMFYGRTAEIGLIVESIDHASIGLLGARRIGKTSLLQAAQRTLEARGKSLYYLDCYYVDNYQTLFGEMADRWGSTLDGLSAQSAIPDFAGAVRALKSKAEGKQIVFELDEVDRLMQYDLTQNRETLFRMFRGLAQQQDCQFIFSGERTLLSQIANPSSPFFNFAVPLSIGLLDREHAFSLVENPMNLIGVSLSERDAILNAIYEQTAGHPNLIQYLCAQLLSELSNLKTREITLALVQQLSNKGAFRDRYLETFWSQSNPLEKIISIYVSESEAGRSQRDIFEFLTSQAIEASMDQVRVGLRYLLLSQLLDEHDEAYMIKAKRFSECIASQSTSRWIAELKGQWKAVSSGG